MITARTQKSASRAKNYFREHLVRGDYYSEGHRLEGHWVGRGAERLGLDLNAPIVNEAYERLCDNRHPLTGEKLTVRTRKDRRIYDDFVIAPPKSVSIMAVTMGDERIVAAHDRAAAVAIVELEKAAGTRVRKGGRDQTRRTGEIVAAVFRHDASRALDPLLHTHVVVFNSTWDPVEKRWKALEAGDMFEQSRFLTEVYRNHLAGELTGLGYRLRESKHGFEIAGVPEAVIARLSKRSQAIARAEDRITEKLGQPLTNNGRAAVAHSTRQRKLRDLPAAELVRRQREQLTPEVLALLEGLRTHKVVPLAPAEPRNEAVAQVLAARGVEAKSEDVSRPTNQPLAVTPERHRLNTVAVTPPPPPLKFSGTARDAVEFARDHLFERRSVVPEMELLTHALSFSRGRFTLEQIRDAVGPQSDLIRVDWKLTTGQALADEKRMIARVNAGLGRCRPLAPNHRPAATLDDEQRRVVESVLHSTDAVMGIRGAAGAGKTFALKEIVSALAANGREVFVFAPTAAAVDVLRKEGFPEAHTVQHLLLSSALQERLKAGVALVDEAGLLSTRQMLQVLELTPAPSARLILCGDTREHTSVEAGDALRLLETYSGLHTAELGAIRRQTEAEYRLAITELAAGQPDQALRRLDRMGAIVEAEAPERHALLAAEYVRSLQAGRTALIVAPTWKEIGAVTEGVRAALKQDGRLGPEESIVTAHRPLQWTEAQRRDFRNYQPGHVLTFHRATRDFAQGEWATVIRQDANQLTLRKSNAQEVTVTRKQVQCFDVASPVRLAIAPGEQLLLQGNQKRDGLLNGQIVTVDAVQPDGSVALKNGHSIPAEFKRFTHGYCVTSQGSQGKTVDHVFVAMDSRSGRAANLNQFYVSASRGRERIRIFTDDKEQLLGAVRGSAERLGAVEVVPDLAARLLQAAGASTPETKRRRIGV